MFLLYEIQVSLRCFFRKTSIAFLCVKPIELILLRSGTPKPPSVPQSRFGGARLPAVPWVRAGCTAASAGLHPKTSWGWTLKWMHTRHCCWIAGDFWVLLWLPAATDLIYCPPLPHPAVCEWVRPGSQKGCSRHPQPSHRGRVLPQQLL